MHVSHRVLWSQEETLVKQKRRGGAPMSHRKQNMPEFSQISGVRTKSSHMTENYKYKKNQRFKHNIPEVIVIQHKN